MGFDFFKKKKRDKSNRQDDIFNPAEEGLEFDDFDSSGEFLSEGEGQAPPPYAPPPTQRPAAPPPPPPQQYQPPRPAPPRARSVPRPAPSRPVGDEHCDDLTMINAPPPAAAPNQPAAPTDRPVPPGPPPRNVQAPPPVMPPVAPPPLPPRQAAPQPPADDVTQVLDAPVGRESLVAWLVLADGPARGRDHRLPGGTIRLGGDPDCDISIGHDQYASAQHAEISFREGQYQIRDLGSTNGTFVNDERVAEAVLRDGDRVRLALTEFVYKSLLLG